MGAAIVASDSADLGSVSSVPSALPPGYTDTAGDWLQQWVVIYGSTATLSYTGWTIVTNAYSHDVVGQTGPRVRGYMLRRKLDGSGAAPPALAMTGGPAQVSVSRAVIRGAHPTTPVDDASGVIDTYPQATAKLALYAGAADDLIVAGYAAAHATLADTLAVAEPASMAELRMVPAAGPSGAQQLLAAETPIAGWTAAGTYSRDATLSPSAQAISGGVAWISAPATFPAVIAGATASATAAADPGQAQARAGIAGLSATVAASGVAGAVQARALLGGATAAATAAADPGQAQARVAISGQPAAATAGSAPGTVQARALIAGASAQVAVGADAGALVIPAVVRGTTAAVVASADPGAAEIVLVIITYAGRLGAPSYLGGSTEEPAASGRTAPTARNAGVETPNWRGVTHAQ